MIRQACLSRTPERRIRRQAAGLFMKKMESIPFVTDEGEEIEFYILEQTTVNGTTYLLVEESGQDVEEAEVYMMKILPGSDADDMETCVFVEDETELTSVSAIFEQLLEDTDLVLS